MSEFNKAITYLFVSFMICFASNKLESSFISNFSNNFIALLTTLLAINIASGSLIAGKLKEISLNTGHVFKKTHNELKKSLRIQIILIIISFVILILKSSKLIANLIGNDNISIFSDTVTVAIFIYYLDSIKDLGQALFTLLDFDYEKED